MEKLEMCNALSVSVTGYVFMITIITSVSGCFDATTTMFGFDVD
jgi:hypothetical protein